MIKFNNVKTYGWEEAARSMRNPLNSWEKNDSYCGIIGENDLELMLKLVKSGTSHCKFRRMLFIFVDITAPLYWWKEFDTYKVGTTTNSCSTMHTITDKKFTKEDFSLEHIGEGMATSAFNDSIEQTIDCLNEARLCYLDKADKNWWWQIIQMLPSSYNQKRTVALNYEVLANIYKDRRCHKLDEWRDMCHMIKNLPYSELIITKK